jgi:tetratricopeptide (TPR) repeat protein
VNVERSQKRSSAAHSAPEAPQDAASALRFGNRGLIPTAALRAPRHRPNTLSGQQVSARQVLTRQAPMLPALRGRTQGAKQGLLVGEASCYSPSDGTDFNRRARMTQDTQSIEGQVRKGVEAHAAEDYPKEVEIWKQVVKFEPDNLHWHANLAHAFAEAGHDEQAEVIFRFIIESAQPVSSAFNNYAALLGKRGVPITNLFPLFSVALSLSETFEHFVRHLLNLCACVALADVAAPPEVWEEVRDNAVAFLRRNKDDSKENTALVDEIIAKYKNYERLKDAIAHQDWDGAIRSIDFLVDEFGKWRLGAVEARRILVFKGQVVAAIKVFSLLDRLGSDEPFSPCQFHTECSQLHEVLAELAPTAARTGSSILLDLLGWGTAELVRQTKWFRSPEMAYDADAHRVPQSALQHLARTRYSELAELFEALLLHVNRIVRRTSATYAVARSKVERDSIIAQSWLKIRVSAHGTVGEYKGLSEVLGRQMLGWNTTPQDRLRQDLQRFKNFVEAQAHSDFYIGGTPHEKIGRTTLQAFLTDCGFREVPIRGGMVDLLVVARDATFVVETKIWRGAANHDDGLVELDEYIMNGSIPNFGGAFYVVFDPTISAKSTDHRPAVTVAPCIETVLISIAPPAPSGKGASSRRSSPVTNA